MTARRSLTSSLTSLCRPRATKTSKTPADVVREILQLWEEGRPDAALLLAHPDVEWLEPPETPDRSIVKGRDQALGALMLWLSTWASFEDELISLSEHGHKVVCEYRQKMVGKASGIEVESERFHVWTVEDGLVTRMAMFTRRDEELTAELER